MRTEHRARTSFVAVLACLVLIGAACSSSGSGSNGALAAAAGQGGPTGGASEVAVRTYGYGPQPASGVTYQPDVVMVPSGPAAIRSATADGVVWTLDRAAKGVDELRIGAVLLATGRAAGRVVALRDDGDSRVVTLAPVQLTDVVRDGEIKLSQALPARSMSIQEVPGLPAASSSFDPGSGAPATTIVAPGGARAVDRPLVLHTSTARPGACACAPGGGTLPPPTEGSVEIPAGDYTITPGYKGDQLTLDVERDGSLKVGVHFAFTVSELSVDSAVSIKSGLIAGSSFVINGIKGMDVSLSAGAAGGEADNEKVRVEVPVEVSVPVPPSPATAGLPLVIKVQFVYSVETAITGKNSTIAATGKYGLDGPIGLSGGNFLTPTFSVEQSIIDSLQGITLGPSGVVFAVKMKVQAGLGIPAASAGPFGSITTSLGITNGSSLGASLVRCKGATLDMDVGGGVSVSISSPLLDALEKLLPPGTEIPNEKELTTNVLHRSQIVPDVPVCNGG